MAERQKDGHTRREHLEAALQAGGLDLAELHGPDCPAIAQRSWDAFRALDDGRQAGGFGPNPIAWSEIAAWAASGAGAALAGFEIDWLRDLDRAYMAHAAEASK